MKMMMTRRQKVDHNMELGTKREQSAEIRRQTKEFKDKGGVVEKIEPGVTKIPDPKVTPYERKLSPE